MSKLTEDEIFLIYQNPEALKKHTRNESDDVILIKHQGKNVCNVGYMQKVISDWVEKKDGENCEPYMLIWLTVCHLLDNPSCNLKMKDQISNALYRMLTALIPDVVNHKYMVNLFLHLLTEYNKWLAMVKSLTGEKVKYNADMIKKAEDDAAKEIYDFRSGETNEFDIFCNNTKAILELTVEKMKNAKSSRQANAAFSTLISFINLSHSRHVATDQLNFIQSVIPPQDSIKFVLGYMSNNLPMYTDWFVKNINDFTVRPQLGLWLKAHGLPFEEVEAENAKIVPKLFVSLNKIPKISEVNLDMFNEQIAAYVQTVINDDYPDNMITDTTRVTKPATKRYLIKNGTEPPPKRNASIPIENTEETSSQYNPLMIGAAESDDQLVEVPPAVPMEIAPDSPRIDSSLPHNELLPHVSNNVANYVNAPTINNLILNLSQPQDLMTKCKQIEYEDNLRKIMAISNLSSQNIGATNIYPNLQNIESHLSIGHVPTMLALGEDFSSYLQSHIQGGYASIESNDQQLAIELLDDQEPGDLMDDDYLAGSPIDLVDD